MSDDCFAFLIQVGFAEDDSILVFGVNFNELLAATTALKAAALDFNFRDHASQLIVRRLAVDLNP